MNSELETIAAQPVEIADYQVDVQAMRRVAVSLGSSFAAVEQIANLSVPLRRPKPRSFSREAIQEQADVRLAKEALAEAEGVVLYHDFRKELGLND